MEAGRRRSFTLRGWLCALEERQGPIAKQALERAARCQLNVPGAPGGRGDQSREHLRTESLDAITQKQIGRAAAAVTTPKPRAVVIFHNERIGGRVVEIPRDAVVEIGPAAVEQAFRAMGQCFVEPIFLFGKRALCRVDSGPPA